MDRGPLNRIFYVSIIDDPSDTEYGFHIEPSYTERATINSPANMYHYRMG
jgi:hypothetical protein